MESLRAEEVNAEMARLAAVEAEKARKIAEEGRQRGAARLHAEEAERGDEVKVVEMERLDAVEAEKAPKMAATEGTMDAE